MEYKEQLDILDALKERFPDEIIEEREGPKKKNPQTGYWEPLWFKYIPVPHVIERLDNVLGLGWSWEVLESKQYTATKRVYNKDTKENTYENEEHVAVLGRLTIEIDGIKTRRDGWGGCELNKGAQAGDCYKIADSNALRKTAAKFGIGSYLAFDEDVIEPVAAYTASQVATEMFKSAGNPSQTNSPGGSKTVNPFLRN